MSRAISIFSSINLSRKKNSSTKKKKLLKFSNFSLSLFLSFLIAVFFSFYLYLNLDIVKINFDLRTKEEEIRNLEKEAKKLEVYLNEPLSLEALEKKAEELGLIRAGDIRYLKGEESKTLSLER